ncbi:MAG: hypothetical protein ABW154_14410 [Dyella sp.]
MNLFWYDWAGYLGVFLLLLAFLLLQAHKLSGVGLVYQIMNIVGALALLLSLGFGLAPIAWPIFSFELAWLLIGVFGVVQTQRRRRALRRDGMTLPPSM